MVTDISLRFAEFVASRLCHDLIAPIGAVNTGLELLQETSDTHLTESEEILNLILHNAHTASARVSFFRAAFGNNNDTLSLEETRHLLENYFIRSKLIFHWKDSFQKDFIFKGWGRLLLNSVLWMSECAPRGGTLIITFLHQQNPGFSLSLKADPLILHQGTLETLEGHSSIEDLSPRTVHCYLINHLLREKNGKLNIRHNPSSSELLLEIQAVS